MTKPETSQNKAEREKLERELGDLTYKIAICNTQVDMIQKRGKPLIERSNEIVNKLGVMDNGER